MNFIEAESQRRKERTHAEFILRPERWSGRSHMIRGCWKGCGERREFVTDGRKEITGNDILKSIVQVNNRASFPSANKVGVLHTHWALCQGLAITGWRRCRESHSLLWYSPPKRLSCYPCLSSHPPSLSIPFPCFSILLLSWMDVSSHCSSPVSFICTLSSLDAIWSFSLPLSLKLSKTREQSQLWVFLIYRINICFLRLICLSHWLKILCFFSSKVVQESQLALFYWLTTHK